MADGEDLLPPPPTEDGAKCLSFKAVLCSSSSSQPFLPISPSQRVGHTQNLINGLLQNSDNNNKLQDLEDGEIPPASVISPAPSRSYANIVKGQRTGLPFSEVPTDNKFFVCHDSLALKPLSVFEGKPCVVFKSSEKKTLINNLKYVLVGKFSHGRPPFSSIKNFFTTLNLQGRYNLSIFDTKHLFIELELKADYVKVWLKLIWTIAGFPMRIFKWGSDFTPGKESAIAPVWIRIEGLPLYLFDKLSLLSIANAIGHPLSVHPLNANRVKLNSALICVELNVSAPLMDSIYVCFEDDITFTKVEGLWLKVFYDVVPPYCSSCLHIGHNEVNCKIRKSVHQSAITSLDEKLVAGLHTLKRSVDSSQPGVPPGIPVELNFKNKQKTKTAVLPQVWKEVKKQGTVKMQQATTSFNTETASNVNRFTSLLSDSDPALDVALCSSISESLDNQAIEQVGMQEAKMAVEQCPVTLEGSETVPDEADLVAAAAEGSATVAGQVAALIEAADCSRPQLSQLQLIATGSKELQIFLPAEEVQQQLADDAEEVQSPANVTTRELQMVSSSDLVAAVDDGKTHEANTQAQKQQHIDLDSTQSGVAANTQPRMKSGELSTANAHTGAGSIQTISSVPIAIQPFDPVNKCVIPETPVKGCLAEVSTPGSWADIADEEERHEKKLSRGPTTRFTTKAKPLTRGEKTTSRKAAADDSLLGKQSNKQDNSLFDLPSNIESIKDVDVESDLRKAGYKLLARRSLSPIGRSSPKLVSLRKKVIYIDMAKNKTILDELTENSEDQLSLAQVCRNKRSNHDEKHPSPSGPGQNRPKRNRRRNRRYYE